MNSVVSCGKVALSGDTAILGIPYWSIGIGGFVAMLAIDVPLYLSWRWELLVALTALSVLGAVAALYFIYQEVAVIGAICPICTGAHACDFAVLGELGRAPGPSALRRRIGDRCGARPRGLSSYGAGPACAAPERRRSFSVPTGAVRLADPVDRRPRTAPGGPRARRRPFGRRPSA